MREQIVLISLLLLWASAAHAAASGQEASLDIIGSSANNTSIIVPEGTKEIGVDIVGSSVSHLNIIHPDERKKTSCRSGRKDCGPCGEEKRYKTPWDDFTRPLCYPWSSYIPTRYNRDFIRGDWGKSGPIEPLPLGRGEANY